MTVTTPQLPTVDASQDGDAAAALRVRERILAMCATSDGAHLGGSMSEVEILLTLYRRVLRIDPRYPDAENRDIFLLSKGHGAAGWYAVLAECGFITDEALSQYGIGGGPFMAHPNPQVPGVEMASGSLGHGLPLGIGFAIDARLAGTDRRVFVVTGDGELQEGSVWEAAMVAGSLGLEHLTAIVDRNGLQITGATENVIRLEPLADRWQSFGWTVREVDGHDMDALTQALTAPGTAGRPTVVIAHTRKGRGIPFVEGQVRSHFAKLDDRSHRRALAALHTGIGAS